MKACLYWLPRLGAAAAALLLLAPGRDRPRHAGAAGLTEGEAHHAHELDLAVSRLQARIRAREALARGLTEGRFTLQEALDRRRRLAAAPGGSGEVQLNALLLDVSYALRGEPPDVEEEALARLRAEWTRLTAPEGLAPGG